MTVYSYNYDFMVITEHNGVFDTLCVKKLLDPSV